MGLHSVPSVTSSHPLPTHSFSVARQLPSKTDLSIVISTEYFVTTDLHATEQYVLFLWSFSLETYHTVLITLRLRAICAVVTFLVTVPTRDVIVALLSKTSQ